MNVNHQIAQLKRALKVAQAIAVVESEYGGGCVAPSVKSTVKNEIDEKLSSIADAVSKELRV